MAGQVFQTGLTQTFEKKEKKVFGVVTAMVVDNVDCTGEMRVMLQLPFLPGFFPWARVATPMAGMGYGSHFIPQPGTEVLVAFHHGDVREPYIIGSLHNTIDRPPALLPTDAITKRTIRTPLGQEVTFDEKLQSVTIKNTTFNTLTLDAKGAMLSSPMASVMLDPAGNITITAIRSLTLQSNVITITGGTVTIASTKSLTLAGGPQCTIAAGQVDIG